MILFDVNIVLAAHRDDHPHHQVARGCLETIIEGSEPFSIPDEVWASYVRIATNPRIFEVPTPLSEAFAFSRAVRSQRRFTHLASGPQRMGLFEELCTGTDASGDLAADAYLAALAIERASTLVSFDHDFARFERLRWVLPEAVLTD